MEDGFRGGFGASEEDVFRHSRKEIRSVLNDELVGMDILLSTNKQGVMEERVAYKTLKSKRELQIVVNLRVHPHTRPGCCTASLTCARPSLSSHMSVGWRRGACRCRSRSCSGSSCG